MLAIETACVSASAALWEGDIRAGIETVTEAHCGERGRTSIELFPAIDRLLVERAWTVADLGGMALSIGPGSFTGLRIGISLVKGLARARRMPIAAIGTLDALARASGCRGTVAACLDAKRGEIFARLFRCETDVPEPLTEEGVFHPGDWAAASRVEGPIWCVGDGAALYRAALSDAWGGRAQFVDAVAMTPAAAVARLGARRLDASQDTPADALLPRYLRRSTAEDHFERGMVGRRRRAMLEGLR